MCLSGDENEMINLKIYVFMFSVVWSSLCVLNTKIAKTLWNIYTLDECKKGVEMLKKNLTTYSFGFTAGYKANFWYLHIIIITKIFYQLYRVG